MTKIIIKENPFDKNLQKNDITSIWAMLIDEQTFKKIHRRKRAKFIVKFH